MPTLFSSGRNLYSPSLLVQESAKEFTPTAKKADKPTAHAQAIRKQMRIIGNSEITLAIKRK